MKPDARSLRIICARPLRFMPPPPPVCLLLYIEDVNKCAKANC